MRKFRVRVVVNLKPSVHDAQGEVVQAALKKLGYKNISEVRQGKCFTFVLEAETKPAAEYEAREMTNNLLANQITETPEIEVGEVV